MHIYSNTFLGTYKYSREKFYDYSQLKSIFHPYNCNHVLLQTVVFHFLSDLRPFHFVYTCPPSLPFSRMGSGFPLPSGVYTLAEVTRRRREQQYIDDNLFNHKSRAAMMVNVAM